MEPGPFNKFERKNGDAILAPEANSESWQARITQDASPWIIALELKRLIEIPSQTIHRKCRRSQIFTMWTLSRSNWFQLDFLLGISHRTRFRKRWSSKAALRLKQGREIRHGTRSIQQNWKRTWRGNTCSLCRVQAPTHAHHTKCYTVKCSPEFQEADRNSSQTIRREGRRSQTSTM